MQPVTIIGLDIAESVFQVHGIDDAGNVVVRQRLRRSMRRWVRVSKRRPNRPRPWCRPTSNLLETVAEG